MKLNEQPETKNQNARVAKLVDALSSGGSIRKVVLVRIQSRAQLKTSEIRRFFLCCCYQIQLSLFNVFCVHSVFS